MENKKMSSGQVNKSPEELLKQYYLTAEDLTIIIPHLKMIKAREYIKDIRKEMKELNYFIPEAKPYVALTKLIKKKFGL